MPLNLGDVEIIIDPPAGGTPTLIVSGPRGPKGDKGDTGDAGGGGGGGGGVQGVYGNIVNNDDPLHPIVDLPNMQLLAASLFRPTDNAQPLSQGNALITFDYNNRFVETDTPGVFKLLDYDDTHYRPALVNLVGNVLVTMDPSATGYVELDVSFGEIVAVSHKWKVGDPVQFDFNVPALINQYSVFQMSVYMSDANSDCTVSGGVHAYFVLL